MQSTLGTATVRNTVMEETHSLTIGFSFTGVATDYFANMEVKLNNDGTVSPIAAVTDHVLGRISSAWQGNDTSVRVVVPFESVIRVYSDAGIDEGQEVSCSGWDATSVLPKYKTSTTGDWVAGICLTAAATTTTTGYVGILRSGGYKKPA